MSAVLSGNLAPTDSFVFSRSQLYHSGVLDSLPKTVYFAPSLGNFIEQPIFRWDEGIAHADIALDLSLPLYLLSPSLCMWTKHRCYLEWVVLRHRASLLVYQILLQLWNWRECYCYSRLSFHPSELALRCRRCRCHPISDFSIATAPG